MQRAGFGMKDKLTSVLRSSCSGLRRRHFGAVTDVGAAGAARYSSAAAGRSTVSHFFYERRCGNYFVFGGLANVLCELLARIFALIFYASC